MIKKQLPISVELKNADGTEILYRTDNVALNIFTFKIFNITAGTLQLIGGSAGSSFNFNFETILTEEVMQNLQVTTPAGWSTVFHPGIEEETAPSWSIAPMSDTSIPEGGLITITLGNIKCATSSPGNFSVNYCNIPGFEDSSFPITQFLYVLRPKTQTPLNLAYGLTKDVHHIVGSAAAPLAGVPGTLEENLQTDVAAIDITYDESAPIENGFTFLLTNPRPTPLVQPTPNRLEVGDVSPPRLCISFLLGSTENDVTSQALADNNIRIDIDSKLPWEIEQHEGDTNRWFFSPKDPKVMAGLETVNFVIRKLITEANVKPDTVSIMYVQFTDVPGYDDAAYAFQLQKRKAEIKVEIQANPDKITLGENVSLTWKSFLAKRLTIKYYDRDGGEIILDSAKGEIKLSDTNFRPQIPPNDKVTIFLASAYGHEPIPKKDDCSVRVTQVKPVINSFTASSQLIDCGRSNSVTLTWDVSNAQTIEIRTPTGDKIIPRGQNSCTLELNAPFIAEIVAIGYDVGLNATATLAILGYKSSTIPMAASQQPQTSPSVLVNADFGKLYLCCNTQINEFELPTLTLVKTLGAKHMAMSESGDKFFAIQNKPDASWTTVTIYDVRSGSQGRDFTGFDNSSVLINSTNINVLTLGWANNIGIMFIFNEMRADNKDHPAPVFSKNYSDHFSFSDDEGEVVSTDSNDWPALIYSKNYSDHFSFSDDESKVYISMPNTKQLRIYKISQDEKIFFDLGEVTPTILIRAKTLKKLYIVCKRERSLLVFDTEHDRVVDTITLEAAFGKVLLAPNEGRLFVANPVQKTISVINTTTDTVVATIPLTLAPFCLAVDTTLNKLFVGHYCEKKVTVVDLNLNKELLPHLNTGASSGSPFELAAHNLNELTTRIFVTKESNPERMTCSDRTADTDLNVSVFDILLPGLR